jgi:transcriptional regulator with XRE-family HTH domain
MSLKGESPYQTLGHQLRQVREQAHLSLAEVSGAVEIEEKQLKLIEDGKLRPDEEIMLLLISYFNVRDHEAMKLWELANYDSDISEHLQMEPAEADPAANFNGKQMVMVVAMDVRTMYTDGADIIGNKSGITINFSQSSPQPNGGPANVTVSRVGMSYQQAEQLAQSLQKMLMQAKYMGHTKLLPPEV